MSQPSKEAWSSTRMITFEQFTVLSYNINFGAITEATAAAIVRCNATIVLLTETTNDWQTYLLTASPSSAAILARYPYHQWLRYEGGAGGQAILSSLPITSATFIPPPTGWFDAGLFTIQLPLINNVTSSTTANITSSSSSSSSSFSPSSAPALSLDGIALPEEKRRVTPLEPTPSITDDDKRSDGKDGKEVKSTIGTATSVSSSVPVSWITIQLLNVHLRPPISESGWPTPRALYQSAQSRGTDMKHFMSLLQPSLPVIIAGDFNESNGQAVKACLANTHERGLLTNAIQEYASGRRTWRWPVSLPFGYTYELTNTFDHILYSAHFICTAARILEEGHSDHLPCIASFILRPGGDVACNNERLARATQRGITLPQTSSTTTTTSLSSLKPAPVASRSRLS